MADTGEIPEDQGGNRAPTPVSSTAVLPSPSTATAPFHFNISTFTHTPFYCEENIYLLCKKLCTIEVADPTGDDLFVVFISNEEKKVPLWNQKASKRIDGLVLWDYHVICVQGKSQRKRERNAHPLVWDLDSSLPFPFPLNQYFAEAIRPLLFVNSRYSRLFRVVHAPLFLRFFASDRGHMKDSQGNWISLPPEYGPIIAADGTVNSLNEYIQMLAADIVTNLEDFIDGVYSSKYGVVEYMCGQLAGSFWVLNGRSYVSAFFDQKERYECMGVTLLQIVALKPLSVILPVKQMLCHHCESCSVALRPKIRKVSVMECLGAALHPHR